MKHISLPLFIGLSGLAGPAAALGAAQFSLPSLDVLSALSQRAAGPVSTSGTAAESADRLTTHGFFATTHGSFVLDISTAQTRRDFGRSFRGGVNGTHLNGFFQAD